VCNVMFSKTYFCYQRVNLRKRRLEEIKKLHWEYVKKAAKCRIIVHCFPLIAIMMTSLTNYIVGKYQVYFACFRVFFFSLLKDRAVILTVYLKTLNLLSVCRELFCFML
jgi:hypothetical protein